MNMHIECTNSSKRLAVAGPGKTIDRWHNPRDNFIQVLAIRQQQRVSLTQDRAWSARDVAIAVKLLFSYCNTLLFY